MFLLIFFISTTSFMEEPGIKVDKPAAGGPAQGESKSIIFAIKTDGRILYDGREIGVNGVRPTVKRLCVEQALPVVIVTDENSRSSSLIKVIDEAKMGGAKDVSLAAEKG
jgi:biopolymer transport protein ExbD